jgi:xylose isomerase
MAKQYPTRYQSVCRWSFHPGKGGFVPADIRPEFKDLKPWQFVELVAREIRPRVPSNNVLGVAVHYDKEINEKTAKRFVRTLKDNGLYIAMATPGAHAYFGYGGIASPDPIERKKANEFGKRAINLALGVLAEAENPECPMVIDLWNGSFGYEIPSIIVQDMIRNGDDSIADLLEYIQKFRKDQKVGVEPKSNEGHSAMIYQTSADVLALRSRLARRGLDVTNFGLINEFGHSEMAGLDVVQDYAAAARDLVSPSLRELLSNPQASHKTKNAIIHVHANSQGADGIRLGGGGKFDIDFGVRPTSSTLGIASILKESGYNGWVEHDMQPRPYDNAKQNIGRVARAICNWDAICRVVESGNYETTTLRGLAQDRKMMEFEDYVADAVHLANDLSKKLYYK